MSSSRREFLRRGTWMALAAGVPLSFSEKASAVGLTATSPVSGLNMAAFKSQLDTTFVIHHEGTKVKVQLVDVVDLAPKKHNASGKEGFSLLFSGSKKLVLEQNTYLIEHEELGMFSFLLVPMNTRINKGQRYEAVINRLYP